MNAATVGFERYRQDVLLRDGESIQIRALTRSDRPLVAALFEDLSPTSLRFRFFASKSGISASDLDRLTRADYPSSVALVATTTNGTGERVLGLGHYFGVDGEVDERGERAAEVAFAVADRAQGRGIGTALLEHLAAIAHAVGIETFYADVMAGNAKMMDVFREAGFEVDVSVSGGVSRVVFPIRDTERFLRASIRRELEAKAASVRPLFEPTSVAVVGASREVGAIGRAILDNLLGAEFRGRVYAVNSSAQEIAGLPCYPTISAIGAPVDLAVIAVPASAVEPVVDDCIRADVRAVVVISAGFAESTPGGREAERRLRERVRAAGMRMVGPNCLGVLNTDPAVRLNATFSPVFPPSGNVSMLSQSGALGLAILDYAEKLHIGIASFASVGNKADVSGNDLLSYWRDDPHTSVIALYLESFGNPRKFARLAPEVARKKPIVAVKSGRSAAGSRAASSHSAALASLDVGVDALFAQAGVIRTDTLEELFDVVALLSSQPVPRGSRVGVVTNAGGPGILLADACEAHGLGLPALAPATVERLRSFLPPQASLGNPVDMIASATPAQYERAIREVGADPNVDAVVAIYVPPLVTRTEDVADAIARGAGTLPAEKPIVAVTMSSRGTPPQLSGGPRGAIPSYTFPENAALALSSAVRYGRWRARPAGIRPSLDSARERAVRAIIQRIQSESPGGGWISTTDLAALLMVAGISFAPVQFVAVDMDAIEAAAEQMGYPVVLKAVAPGMIHKTDAGGVVLGLDRPGRVREAGEQIIGATRAAGFELSGFLVQRQVTGVAEALVGVTTDPSLGPLLVAGLGGIQVELLRDVAVRLTPVSDLDAAEMLAELRTRKLLDGYRGAPPADRDALIRTILAVSMLVEVIPELVELDLNPVLLGRPGDGAVVLDGRLRLGPSES